MSTPPAPESGSTQSGTAPRGSSGSLSQSRQSASPRRRRRTEEDESVGDLLIDEIDETFNISGRLLGCAWTLISLPFRFIGRLFGFLDDLF